jgi:hypothetical protein
MTAPLSASYGTRASVEYLPLRHKCRLFREGRMADHLDHVAELERARAAGRVPDEYYFQALALEPTLRDGPSA